MCIFHLLPSHNLKSWILQWFRVSFNIFFLLTGHRLHFFQAMAMIDVFREVTRLANIVVLAGLTFVLHSVKFVMANVAFLPFILRCWLFLYDGLQRSQQKIKNWTSVVFRRFLLLSVIVCLSGGVEDFGLGKGVRCTAFGRGFVWKCCFFICGYLCLDKFDVEDIVHQVDEWMIWVDVPLSKTLLALVSMVSVSTFITN